MASFQNCAPASFQFVEQANLSSRLGEKNVLNIRPPETCEAAGFAEFSFTFDRSSLYACYDLTSQEQPIGPICTEAPR